MRLICAIKTQASALSMVFSQSLARRRQRPSQSYARKLVTV